MKIIVGLGNPGVEYEGSRHNTGRSILMVLAKKWEFSPWKTDVKLKALTSTGSIEKKKVMFVLPETFMNLSGKSVVPLIESKKALDDLLVIYDDLDLPLGRIKLSHNRSAGGHNGVASIIKSVKSEAFTRIRVGVSPETPGGKLKKPTGESVVVDFLMKKFREPEMVEFKKIIKKSGEAIETFVTEGREMAMTKHN
ncbi:MAG: aminoacyl-tRNA hydrolase [Candidatus Pacebacteria bacterium]|nr:aminoacyl-tRNA hydrolase [Candidatus Paceibacterota bacterium]MBP9772896.1 aminoacyl-tRNA hydrolase [Candidatus Paceibacterota bacterium]